MGFAGGRRPRRDRSRLLDSQQPDECHTPRFARPTACDSRAGRPGTRALVSSCPYCAERRALTCAAGRAAGRSPARSRPACSGRAARSNSGPRWRTASRLTACSRAVPHDALRSARRRAGTFAATCSRSARRRAAAAARARTGSAGSRGHICAQEPRALIGAWAYSAEDCERVFERRGGGWAYRQPVDKFAQAAIVESPKKILLPSATCQIDAASQVEGALKVNAECASSISFTSRSTVIMLRSPTELVYSASGDAVLATTLKKCAQ
jgi:hypothetical protein